MAKETVGTIKDKDGKPVEVQWDDKTEEIWVHWPGSFLRHGLTKKVPSEKASSGRQALDKAYAYLIYG